MKYTKSAFKWIVSLLNNNKIPFQITGGFAAKIYGSKRKLYDIDIEIPDNDIKKLQKIVRRWIVYGPKRYKDKNWDILLVTLKYKDQLIDISGAYSEKEFDKKMGSWIRVGRTNLSKAKKVNIYGIKVPVESKRNLIAYKKKLSRNVDKEDLRQISGK